MVSTVARSLLTRYGTAWTIRTDTIAPGVNSWTAGATTSTFRTVLAHLRDEDADPLREALQSPDGLLIIDATGTAAPRPGDLAAIGSLTSVGVHKWRTVTEVQTATKNGVALVYRVTVR